MKKLIIIILAMIMTFFSAPQKGANQPHVTDEKPLQTAITTTVEQVPEESEMAAETAFVGDVRESETKVETEKSTITKSEVVTEETEVLTEEKIPSSKEEKTEECTKVIKETITEPEKDTVECIDEGDQSLAEYKPQIGGQPNPFENDTPTEIDDRPVEDYIGEGEDRPGEGKHF